MKNDTPTPRRWPGYTLEDLRYQQALNLARREIIKVRLEHLAKEYHDNLPVAGGRNNMVKRILSSLTFLDYAALIYGTTRRVTKIVRHFRGK